MFVEKETELQEPQQDGLSKRAHLESIVKQTGEPIEELDMPDLPPAGMFTMFVFRSLCTTSFSYQEIKAWCELTNTHLTGWHLNTLQQLDAVRINTSNRLASVRQPRNN